MFTQCDFAFVRAPEVLLITRIPIKRGNIIGWKEEMMPSLFCMQSFYMVN